MTPYIDSSNYLANHSNERSPNPELGKDEFLKILMTQLQNQDPLDPMDDKDFISQMATFSSLEQTMNMASSLEQMVQNQFQSPVAQYSHMIGQEVTYEDENGEEALSGVIAVSQKDGKALLELANEEQIAVEDITKIQNALNQEED